MNHLPNINSETFTLSAIIVGLILIGDLNSTEQNALGNWFMLVGQILETNGSYKFNGENNANIDNPNQTINMLKKTIKAMEKEIEILKKYSS